MMIEPFDLERLRDRFAGCLLGGAIGDALGMPAEGLTREQIRAAWGWLDRFADPAPDSLCRTLRAGQYTDDTQLALLLVESLLDHGTAAEPEWAANPEDFGRRVAEWHRRGAHAGRGPGVTCLRAAGNLARGVTWEEAGIFAAGNGTAMRAAPLGLWLCDDVEALRRAAGENARVTHTDPLAIAGSEAVAYAVARLAGTETPEALDGAAFVADVAAFVAPTSERMARAIRHVADLLARPLEEGFAATGTGGFVLETVPAALLAFLRSPGDFAGAVLAAANTEGDPDTLACITGNLSGALLGAGRVPPEWRAGVEDGERIARLAGQLADLVSRRRSALPPEE